MINAFLILTNDFCSEWIYDSNNLQIEMMKLQNTIGNDKVTVQQFINSELSKEITYTFDGQYWNKI